MLYGICVLALFSFFFFWSMHFGVSPKGSEHREKPPVPSFRQLWSQVFTHCLYNGWKYPKRCSLPCHHPPQIHPCHSSYTAPPGCFYQTQNSGVGTQSCDAVDVGIEAYFIAALTISCSELAYQPNDCHENVRLETSGWFLSPKKVKWFILFQTSSITSRPSTRWQLANVHLIPLSVSHYIW